MMSFSLPYFCIFSNLILVSLEYAYLNKNSCIGPTPSELGNLEKLGESSLRTIPNGPKKPVARWN